MSLNSSFSNNRAAESGGAIKGSAGANVTLSHTSLLLNAANDSGGALAADRDAEVTIEYSTFANNKARSGGAVHLSTGGHAALKRSRLVNNTATDGVGGACSITKAPDLLFLDCQLRHNRASSYGGGVFVTNGRVNFTGSVIAFNHAWAGGGVMAANTYQITFDGTNVTGNVGLWGGGLAFDTPYTVAGFSAMTSVPGAFQVTMLGGTVVTNNTAMEDKNQLYYVDTSDVYAARAVA